MVTDWNRRRAARSRIRQSSRGARWALARATAALLLALTAALLAPSSGAAGATGMAPFAQAAVLIPSEANRDPSPVEAVAISGDGGTIVLGAPRTNNGDDDLGSAYVFQRTGPSWEASVEVAVLTASDSGAGDLFGSSVAVSGDGGVVAVGAAGAGAVYVFERTPTTWESVGETARLSVAGAGLGRALAISADGSMIVAGAPAASAGYLFERPATGWASGVAPTRLSSSAPTDEQLGAAAAVADDGSLVALGAPLADRGGQDRGAVLVFARPAAGWSSITETAVLTATDAADQSQLGGSLALSADGATIAAGASGARTAGVVTGAAYAFQRPAAGWSSGVVPARLSASDTSGRQVIGGSVAASASGTVIAVGASGGAGAALVYSRTAAAWAPASEVAALSAADPQQLAALGASLALSDDGLSIVAGAPVGLLGAAGPSGAAFVFETHALALSLAAAGCLPASSAGGMFNVLASEGARLSVTSLNQTVAPDSQITLTPSGPGSFLLSIRAADLRTGAARIVVTASNGLFQTSQSITMRVGAASGSVVNGTIGPDLLVGGGAEDTLVGRGGADVLCGRGGNDILLGNEGADALDGHAGDDILQGGDGDDTLTGGEGADSFRGGEGFDTATDFSPAQGDTSDGTIP